MIDKEETEPTAPVFDPTDYPKDTLFHERRHRGSRRQPEIAGEAAVEPGHCRRTKRQRRKRVDPTTFEKQYTSEEIEFMNAIQQFKMQSGKAFPTHGDTLRVAIRLGYRQIHNRVDRSIRHQTPADDV